MRSGRRVIWKFPFPVQDDITIEMPAFAEILHVDVQNGVPTLWAIVDPQHVNDKRTFHLYGTGHEMHIDTNEKHIGSFLMYDGSLVFHLFEVLP